MKKSRFTKAQIIAILRQAEGGIPVLNCLGLAIMSAPAWRSAALRRLGN